MFTIEVKEPCACFNKSGFEAKTEYESREDMINRARVMECRMNQEFCMTHFFEAVDYNDHIIIHRTLRPEDDEDDDYIEDAGVLVRSSVVTIGFDGSEEPSGKSGGN
ncbi:MAG: hypothetical protein Q9M32_01885 [Sulfurimonas sp.]|nr:hypothetical protein [Sulfurimonas sp.]MDQ7060340.1 hypothetical protein [Sulfurimonas sp.]